MLKKRIAIVLLILIIGSVILSLLYMTLPLLQEIVQGIYHGGVHLIQIIQNQPLWIQIALGVILIVQFFSFVDLAGGIFITPQMSWGERLKWLAIYTGLFIGSSLFILLSLPFLIRQLKFVEWIFPLLLVLGGIRVIWWIGRKAMMFYKTRQFSKSRQFSNFRRGRAKRGWW